MADHHQAVAPIGQFAQQPLAPGAVEVVAGFVQDQQLRCRQQRSDQRDPGQLAATESVGLGVGGE